MNLPVVACAYTYYILGSGHSIFMGVGEDYPRSKLFCGILEKQTFFFKNGHIMHIFFYKLLVRNKLVFKKISEVNYLLANSSGTPYKYQMTAPLEEVFVSSSSCYSREKYLRENGLLHKGGNVTPLSISLWVWEQPTLLFPCSS